MKAKYIPYIFIAVLLIGIVSADTQISNSECGVEESGDCPDDFERTCWREDSSNAIYFTCEMDGDPQCPSDFPYYCSSTSLCYVNPNRCSCIGVTCDSSCSGETLFYNGNCMDTGSCTYQTESVDCCSDNDCSSGEFCRGSICASDELAMNLGFEEWSTDVSPDYWDVSTNVYVVQKSNSITEGDFSLGLNSIQSTGYISDCLYAEVSQDLDFSGVDELRYDCSGSFNGCFSEEIISGDTGQVVANKISQVFIDSEAFETDNGENIIDVSSLSGLHTVKFSRRFCVSNPSSWGVGNSNQFIDNVRLIANEVIIDLECNDKCVGDDYYSNGIFDDNNCIYEIEQDSELCSGVIPPSECLINSDCATDFECQEESCVFIEKPESNIRLIVGIVAGALLVVGIIVFIIIKKRR